MIFGDPEKFAIWFDRVESWSDDRFDNGVLFYMADCKIIGENVKFPTLGDDFGSLEYAIPHVQSQHIDLRLCELPTIEAYEEIYNRTFAIGFEENNYSYRISTMSHGDAGEHVFLLRTPHEFERLLFGFGPDGKLAKEVRLPKGEVLATLQEAVSGFEQIKTRRSDTC